MKCEICGKETTLKYLPACSQECSTALAEMLAVRRSLSDLKAAEMCSIVAYTKLAPEAIHEAIKRLKAEGGIRVVSMEGDISTHLTKDEYEYN